MAGESRIEEIAENNLTPEQKSVFEALVRGRGRLLTPYKVWIHSPKTAEAMERLGTYLNKASSLSEREVELAIVLAAHHWQGEYVYTVHVKRCLELGVPQRVIDAIAKGETPDFAAPRERAIYEIAALAQQPGAGSDEAFGRALQALGRKGLAELLALLGYYSSVAIAMKLHRVPLPR